MSSLTDRIALILQTEAASDALVAIIDDAQDELDAAEQACAEAQTKVLDPLSTTAVVTKAKRDLEDQTLAASRLKVALERLSDQLEMARAREAEAERLKRYEEAKAEREAAINEFQEKYPELAAQIATMLKRCATVDQKLAAINQDLPQNGSYLYLISETVKTVHGWAIAPSVKLLAPSGVEIPEHLRVAPGQIQFWPMARGF